jgi:hypothetical protein
MGARKIVAFPSYYGRPHGGNGDWEKRGLSLTAGSPREPYNLPGDYRLITVANTTGSTMWSASNRAPLALVQMGEQELTALQTEQAGSNQTGGRR